MPLWPRAERSGSSPEAIVSSSFVAPAGQGRSSGPAAGGGIGRRLAAPEADRSSLRHRGRPPRLGGSSPPAGRWGASEARAPAPPASAAERRRSMRARMRRSRSSSRSSMSGGNRYRPPAVRTPKAMATAYSDSWVIDSAMRPMPELLGPSQGPAVEAHRRLAGGQPLDLDVAPADAPHAQAQDLADGLLGRPAAGHRLGPVAHVALFVRGQHPVGEARPEALQGRPDALDLDDVDAQLGRARAGRGHPAGAHPTDRPARPSPIRP